MSMSVHTKTGESVIYANFNAGHDSDRRLADSHLIKGWFYKITKMDVYSGHSDVFLEGFEEPFNSVLFDNIPVKVSSKEFLSTLKQYITDGGHGDCVEERTWAGLRTLKFNGKPKVVLVLNEDALAELDKGGE